MGEVRDLVLMSGSLCLLSAKLKVKKNPQKIHWEGNCWIWAGPFPLFCEMLTARLYTWVGAQKM